MGTEQFSLIREALARLNLTDGLSFPELTLEAADRLPRDATVIAILPQVSPETAIALASLRKQGYAVTALVNVFESLDFATASGPLLAEGIEVRHLRDEDSIASICRKYALASVT